MGEKEQAPEETAEQQATAEGKVRVEGPCGDGSGPANRCEKHNQCCTNHCDKKKRRCRCLKLGQACDSDHLCCPGRTGRSCRDGRCQATTGCGGPGAACEEGLACCEGEICREGVCQSPPACVDVCASGCQFTSLQQAINEAGDGETITICAGTYEGNITITKDLTLVGDGADATTLQGDGTTAVVDLDSTVTATIRDLTITGGGGNSPGAAGGIFIVSATLTLAGVTVTGNTSGSHGGGITNDGTLTLNDCTVTGNTAGQNGGGIFTGDGNTLTLNGGTVSGNMAGGFGGGIFNGTASPLTLNACTVSGNTAHRGGGIANFGTVTLEDGTTVTDNDAGDDGGGIFNNGGTSTCTGGSSVSGNTPNDCVAINGGDCGTC